MRHEVYGPCGGRGQWLKRTLPLAIGSGSVLSPFVGAGALLPLLVGSGSAEGFGFD